MNADLGSLCLPIHKDVAPAQRGVLDTLIAATAVANGLPLYTVNPDDYQGITNLTVVAIPHPDAQP